MSRYLNTPIADADQDPLTTPIAITDFPDQRAKSKSQKSVTLRELARLIEETTAISKDRLPWLKGAVFGNIKSPKGCLRHNHNVQKVTAVEVDYDAGDVPPEEAVDRLKARGIAGLIYTTPSDGLPGKGRRWRGVFPLKVAASPERRAALVARVNGALGGIVSAESFTLSQSFYYGGVKGTAAIKTHLVPGRYLDTATDLDAGAVRGNRRTAEPGTGEPTGLPFSVFRSAAMACPNDGDAYASRDAWLTFLMAIHAERGGDDIGRALALDWSAQWPGHDADETEQAWDSFNAGKGVSGWHIIREARRHGWRDATVDTMERQDLAADFDEDDTGYISDAELAEIDALIGTPVKVDHEEGLTFLSPSECALLPARPYVVKGLLAGGDVAAIVGAPGAGKSLLAPRLGYAVAQGQPVFGRRTRQGGVFYVAAEDGHGMRGRLSALRIDHGEADTFQLVTGVSDLLSKGGQIGALKRAVKARRPSLVIIDTLAVAFPGLEENSAEGMGQVVAAARGLAQWGAAVVLIHHDTKAGDGLPRGHSLLNGALEMALCLTRDGGVVTGQMTKNRNGSTDTGLAFTIGTRTLGKDEDGDAILAAIAEEADPAEVAPRGPKLTGQRKVAFEILMALGGDNGTVAKEYWRKGCHESSAFSGADDQNGKNKAFRRQVEELTRSGFIVESTGGFTIARAASRGKKELGRDFDD